jgi:hypothetical protein
MPRSPLVATAISSMLLVVKTAIAQTFPPNRYAQADQSWRIGHLSRVNKNGDGIYVAADGRLSAMLNAKGLVMPPTNRPAGLDCYGKTLEDLRSSGRVMEFERAK